MSPAMLELHNVIYEKEGKRILSIPGFTVNSGETLVVLGPNGAGKSTLLKLLGLIEKPHQGMISWKGSPITPPLARIVRRSIAMVLQEPFLFDMTVRDNIAYGLRIRKTPPPVIEEKVYAIMAQLGITHLQKRSPRGLSGGESHRVSLARALVLEPELLLLDEPFNSLDTPAREEQQHFLKELLSRAAITAVYVTHDRKEAFTMAHTMALLMNGRVAQAGSPAELFTGPLTSEIASFMGFETIARGAYDGGAPGDTITVEGRQIRASMHNGSSGHVFICIRAEEVELSTQPRVGMNNLTATVLSATNMGNCCRVKVDAGFPLTALVPVYDSEELDLAVGQGIIASFAPRSVHIIPTAQNPATPAS